MLGQCIIVGIANGSNREVDLGFSQPLGLLYRQVLRSAVRIMSQILVIRHFSLPYCLLKCIHCPAGDLKGKSAEWGPTIRRVKTSITTATLTVPAHVGTQVKSKTQSLFGRSALNRRCTVSLGHGGDVSGWVVITFLPCDLPPSPPPRGSLIHNESLRVWISYSALSVWDSPSCA